MDPARDGKSGPKPGTRAGARLSYANVMSTIAVFGVLAGGGAYAATKIGPKEIERNAIRAKHIKRNQVRAKHIKRNAVRTKQIKRAAVRTPQIGPGAVTAPKLAPGVSVPPSGPAGGELAGSYPSPTLAPATPGVAVAGARITSAGSLLGYFNRRGGQPQVEPVGMTGRDVTFPGVSLDPLTTIATATILGGFSGEVYVGFVGDSFRVRTEESDGMPAARGFSLVVYEGVAPG